MAAVICPECHHGFAERAERPPGHLVECPRCRRRFPRPVGPGAGRLLAVAGTALGLVLFPGCVAGWVGYRQYQRAHRQDTADSLDGARGKDSRAAGRP